MCGGTNTGKERLETLNGLSPRVRGNPAAAFSAMRRFGSIPACAGEPVLPPSALHSVQVYPRVCGGTVAAAAVGVLMAGLSPRVRGNLSGSGSPISRAGSIPACAGEPRSSTSNCSTVRVYPRVCGGTSFASTVKAIRVGLSPRVRGNQRNSCHFRLCTGSIPACAGEPC